MLAAINFKNISMHTPYTRVIQFIIENSLLNTLTCIVDFAGLQLNQTILNSSHMLGASVQ